MRWLPATCLLLLLLAVTPSQAGILNDILNQIAGMFRHYEELPYTVTTTGHGYEERLYPMKRWVCTAESTSPGIGEDLSHLFWPLYGYMSGQNDRKEVIPMTVPVTTEFTARGPDHKVFKMCFFLGEEHQANPPHPTASGVYIQARPEMRVLTRTVGGYMTSEEDWLQEAGKLAAVLEGQGITVSLSHNYWVGYDAPLKFWRRRNEVWFPVDD